MFKMLASMEDSLRSKLEAMMGSKMASSAVRALKGAATWELTYVLTHTSNPTDPSQLKNAALAGLLLGLQKFITWKE